MAVDIDHSDQSFVFICEVPIVATTGRSTGRDGSRPRGFCCRAALTRKGVMRSDAWGRARPNSGADHRYNRRDADSRKDPDGE